MDDDRPIQPDDLDASLDRVRPHAARLLRLATIATGDPAAGVLAAAAAVRAAWRDSRRLPAENLPGALEARLISALSRRRSAAGDTPLDRALAPLRRAERVALARCLDPAPDAAALAVAGRAGVEISRAPAAWDAADAGEIVDLDGPLAGWDLGVLRTALAAAAGPGDAVGLMELLRGELRTVEPETGWRAALRAANPGRGALARVGALTLVAVLGMGLLAWGWPLRGEPAAPGVSDTLNASPGSGARGPVDSTGDRTAAEPGSGTTADFPAVVDGYPVISVDTAHRLAGGGTVTGRALAVRGWMSAILLPGPCAVPDAPAGRGVVSDPLAPEAAFCRRVAILRESPIREWDVAHLHPQLLPGTGLGDATAALSVTGRDRVPIVLLAHFGDPRLETCASGDPRCGEEVVVDRVLWVAGQSIEPPAAVRPIPTDPAPRRTPADAGAIVDEAFIGVRVTSIAGVPAGDLGQLEPAAAAAGHGTDYAWLVRATIDPATGGPAGAASTWFVVDDATGTLTAAPGVLAWAPDVPARAPRRPGVAALFPRPVDWSWPYAAGWR